MYSYISLKVDCPHCGKSLMDSKKLIDDIPSIRMNISLEGNNGTINLSSFYGSYQYESSLMIKNGTEYTFSCPFCNENITSDSICDECSSQMIPLHIRDGGKVRFCSRAGCKNHNVQFEDLSHIHDYFHLNIGTPEVVEINNKAEKKEQKELIKSGTFLHIYCPHCENGLIEKNSVLFKVINQYDERGYLLLSPYLNVFANQSTVFIPEGAVAKDILCPFCDESLIAKNVVCEKCSAPAVEVIVAALRRMIEFFFCTKKGCHWHNLCDEDLQYVMLEDSIYW
ncbi:MAG TPA: hypothetical protein VMX55_03175 [candidate division Zixibacteria bacterium]|nr:hypothetical protein [candidate division Zixibacteria bacterium]